MLRLLFLLSLVSLSIGDTYLHWPRGANNRLNEASANRNNGNRMCDTQNNNRGGYNVGELNRQAPFTSYGSTNQAARDGQLYNTQQKNSWDNPNGDKLQMEEVFKAGSIMQVSWTSQHGCSNDKNNCNMVFDYTCDTKDWRDDTINANQRADGQDVQLMSGLNTGTPQDANSLDNVQATKQNNDNNGRGRHESETYYLMGKLRSRNKGLFTADQKVHGSKQINTRQNPGGTRRGLEIPEERDYFPWWFPSPWRPVAYLSSDTDHCEDVVQSTYSGANSLWHCIPAATGADAWDSDYQKCYDFGEEECTDDADCEWYEDDTNVGVDVDCADLKWSATNNLGNVEDTPDGGLPQIYNWTIPTADELIAAGCHAYEWEEDGNGFAGPGEGVPYFRLVFRQRYNISTGDYDPYTTDASCNQDTNLRVQSPVQNNPTVDIGVEMQGLRLAINTAQTGRTFQDRTHVFRVSGLGTTARNLKPDDKKIHTVSVQGKRGNIVQTFPSVEYDFWPKTVYMEAGDCMDIQWTGSNTHNNGNPAGDGQAGDAGEGRGGSDRHNLIQVLRPDATFPMPLDKPQFRDMEFFHTTNCLDTAENPVNTDNSNGIVGMDAQISLMSGGFYNSYADIEEQQGDSDAGVQELDPLLNNAPGSLRPLFCCTTEESKGEYYFTNTRNNNFSNRDQKLKIVVY